MQGMALLPTPREYLQEEEDQSQQSGEHQQPDALLARASFVGDLFLGPCFLFAPTPDRHQQPPQQIAVSVLLADAGERQADGQAERQLSRQANREAERQGNGQPARQGSKAAGPVRPTARRQTREAMLQAMGVAASQALQGNVRGRIQVRTRPAALTFAPALPFFLALLASCSAQESVEGHDLQADVPSNRQHEEAKAAAEKLQDWQELEVRAFSEKHVAAARPASRGKSWDTETHSIYFLQVASIVKRS